MSFSINRRRFITSGLTAGAITTVAPTSVLALSQTEPNAIIAILKRRLPNIELDEDSTLRYANDLIQRMAKARGRDGQVFARIFKREPDSRQLEHFVVQDFLVRSSALRTAHLGRPASYHG